MSPIAAFPVVGFDKDQDAIFHTGMTLRDYFAARAMTHFIQGNSDKNAATLAYQVADAMLAERAK